MELYKQISDANRIKYGTEAEKILRIIINQYSDRTHFIYEILQNAEDAGATRIQFHLEKEKLVIKHDGRPFNEKDIEGVCGIANGTKEDGTRIGHFGIGFKSVYCYTEHPYIYSGEYHFVIQNQLFPKEVPGSQEIAYDETCMILPFDKGEVPSSIAYQEIRDALTKKITAESIIMLNQISDVRIKIDGYPEKIEINKAKYSLDKKAYADNVFGLSMNTTITNTRSKQTRTKDADYLFFTDANAEATAIIFRVEGKELKAIKNSKIYAFFPTAKEAHQNFYIHCSLEGHKTEEVLVLIWVNQKKGGRKSYIFVVGYCSQCQKYYMDIDDYNVIYSLGRPEVTIISDVNDADYQITSGEVFNLERNHLNNIESGITGEIKEIHESTDYVNPYAVGDYDDGNLSFAKSLSANKYGKRLEELENYIPKPYSYRVDISADGATETYYIGASDVILKDGKKVISTNSDLGYELINYQTIKIHKDGKEYGIKLSRQFDIDQASLYGYVNLRTDEDVIFQSGITDPFLVRVLNIRKKQHNLTDIFVTIQENQNKIVNTDFNKNIIVQGCAGSGKTMVLLHRLSALKYRQRYFDFSQNALILTPNEQFSLHIKGLAEGLQIGSVHRISVEQYYLDMLLQYDSAFKPENKIVSEMQVRQDYVDYIYSDQFKNDFERAYNDILEKRNGLVDILIQLQEAMNQEKKTISWTEESRFTIQMKYSVDALNDLLRKKEQDFASAQDKITKAEERRAFLEDRIPASEQFAKSIVQESLPRVNTKIGEYVLEKQQEIEALNKKIQELQEEYARIQGALIIFGKRAKLEKLDADIEEVKAKVIPLQTQLDEQKKILSMRQDGKEDDEILAWMKQVSVYIKKVQDEVRLCSNAKEEYSRFFNELSESDDNIKAAYEGYHRVEAEQYSEEIKKTIQYLYEQLEKYSLVNIYQQIYDESVQVFKEKNGVKSITGKCHRYDLYVQLMFAMKYFNKKIGNMQFICVDEGQDLAVNEYRLLSELNQNHVVFNIFGDTNQLMKSGRGISDWNLLLSELQAEQYVLNENYRNTNQITRFCNDIFGLKTLQTGVDGPKVREISRRDLEKELAGLMITTERIAILLPRTVQKMKYLDMDILPENIRNMIGETMDNGFISVMYVDEVKGIEFDKVFVVSAAMHRNEKYIAYTRALSELIVVVDEKLMNNNSAKKVKENIEHNKKAGIHSAKMPGTLKWEKTKQPKAYTLEKTIDNDVITYHFTENTKSIIKNEFANTDSILPSSIASSPLTNIKKNIYAHCVYIENSICYNINCKENMGKKCNKEGNCDYYISLPVPPDEEELIAEDIDNAKKYLAKYS